WGGVVGWAGGVLVGFVWRSPRAGPPLRRRPAPLWREEVVEVFLAPVPDGASAVSPATSPASAPAVSPASAPAVSPASAPAVYYEIEVNPLGALFDARVHNPDIDRATMRVETAWDWPDIRWRAGRHGAGHDWWATLDLPFSGLGFEAEPPARWMANFYRVERPGGAGGDPADAEYSAWAPTLVEPADFHRPDRFGLLELEGLRAPSAEPGPRTRAAIPRVTGRKER
ncbi:MAG: carbohydrate-binding family 9-like protein, partial [Acidobacteriota bacterium]